MQAFVDEHSKPPPPLHGSLKEIFTGTLRVFVNDVANVTYAVGGIVSALMKNKYNQKKFQRLKPKKVPTDAIL